MAQPKAVAMIRPFVPEPLPRPPADVVYPSEDGERMGETELHVAAMILLREVLRLHFRKKRPDICITADMFLYYEQGNPKARKAPDVMVIKGVGSHARRVFKVWEEKAVPSVIFEISSADTIKEDRKVKPLLYARLGVKEYFLIDPEQDYLDPPLQGFRLKGRKYVPIVPNADGSLTSEELGIRLLMDADGLRLFDSETDSPLLSAEQMAAHTDEMREEIENTRQRFEREQQQTRQERERAEQAEAELARLREQLKQQGGGKKRRR
jgi:Uma2 family endonuclease